MLTETNTMSSLDNTDVLYISADKILNFSENWKSLYRPYPWPTPIAKEDIKTSYKTDDYSNIIEPSDVRHSCRPYISNDCFVASNFMPNNHSTPNNKLNSKEERLKNSANNTPTEAVSFSTTYPGTSLSSDRCHDSSYTSCGRIERCASIETLESANPVPCIPSISRDIDTGCSHKYTCKEIYCERSGRDRRVRKTGIKGVRCIVSFALTDDPVKKRTQIQACSISVMILAIVTISFVLVYFTSDRYKAVSVTVPTLHSNSSANKLRNANITMNLPIVNTQKAIPSTAPPLVTTQLLNDAPIIETNNTISEIIQKIRKNVLPFPKHPRRSESTKNTSNDGVKNANESRSAIEEFCIKCQKDEQVCMLNEESGIPVCINAVDRHDPTGCGGLCALETEACQVVDRARGGGVRVCRSLTALRCTGRQWRCYNGLCVSNTSRCDGIVDCYDRSDEMHCECDLAKHFRCGHSTSCFPNSKLCDGVIDCWDGRDELNCTNACPKSEFTCNNGQCISNGRFCDGLADCSDGSDEPNGCDAGCSAREYRCGNKRCIARSMRCNGVDNCGDGSDEVGCS